MPMEEGGAEATAAPPLALQVSPFRGSKSRRSVGRAAGGGRAVEDAEDAGEVAGLPDPGAAAAGKRGMAAGGVDDETGPGGHVVRVDGAIHLQRPAALAHEHGQSTIEAGPVEVP